MICKMMLLIFVYFVLCQFCVENCQESMFVNGMFLLLPAADPAGSTHDGPVVAAASKTTPTLSVAQSHC